MALCAQYWRLEDLKSFDELLERRFPRVAGAFAGFCKMNSNTSKGLIGTTASFSDISAARTPKDLNLVMRLAV